MDEFYTASTDDFCSDYDPEGGFEDSCELLGDIDESEDF